MARIPNDQIERIKQEVSLLRLVESQGYKPKKQGKDYVVHSAILGQNLDLVVKRPFGVTFTLRVIFRGFI